MRISISAVESAKLETVTYTKENGVYVSATPTKSSVRNIMSLISGLDLDPDLESKLHVTVCYSPEKTISRAQWKPGMKFSAIVQSVDTFTSHDDKTVVALAIVSENLVKLHSKVINAGAEHTFCPYKPHMTLFTTDEALTTAQLAVIRGINQRLAKSPLVFALKCAELSDIAA